MASTGAATPPGGENFDDVVLPHMEAAYRLARWLLQNDHDAQDVVQEASLRAFRYFRTYMGGNGRAWFLRIVRNTCRDWHRHPRNRYDEPFDERQHNAPHEAPDPETQLLQTDDVRLVTRAMGDLSLRARELLTRRELEGHSYQELAETMGIPMGTVMSGLSRARQAFRGALERQLEHEACAACGPAGGDRR